MVKPVRCCVVTVVLFAAGCPSTEVIQHPREAIGKRLDAKGNVVQQLVLEQVATVKTYPFTPEGPHRSGTSVRTYFLEEPGKPRRELSFLSLPSNFCESYLPVETSTLWVGTLYEEYGDPVLDPDGKIMSYAEHLWVIVFDDQGIVHHRTFSAFWVDSEDEAFGFRNGNRTLVFRSPKGFQQYDVLADTVTDVGPQSDEPPRGPLP